MHTIDRTDSERCAWKQWVELLTVNYRDRWCCSGILAQPVIAILCVRPRPMGLFPRLYVNPGNETQTNLVLRDPL